MKKMEWNYSIIGFDTYEEAVGLFQCEILLKPDWWKFWYKKQTIIIVGDEKGWYTPSTGQRVPKEMNENVIDWFTTWKASWLQEMAVM